MLSPRRRQVIIAGLASTVAPAAFAAFPKTEAAEKLVLSGRILGPEGKPLSGAIVGAGPVSAVTDADGRFVLVTHTRSYRVSYRGRSAEGFASDPRPDGEGTWRASFALTLA